MAGKTSIGPATRYLIRDVVSPSLAFAITGRAARAAYARRWNELQPDIVLVEGPPDAQGVLPLLTGEG